MSRQLFISLAAVVCLMTSCSRPKPVVVGSKDSTEQKLLAEITAQHLEHRLPDTPVQRRLSLGDTGTLHQAVLNGEISLYPEYSGLIITEVLRESPSEDPAVVMERSRMELKRLSLLEYLAPFGFESRNVLVARASDADRFTTASEAAASSTRWKVGLAYEFQNKETGLPSLNTYRFQMGAPLRSMRTADLFSALQDNSVSLIVASATDGHLTDAAYKILPDDQNAFPPMAAALVVRDDVLAAEPKLRDALNELSNKISLDTMRKLNAEVELAERTVEDVARDFLKSAGLN
jgi:osmoprotectant transport system substrate-binding protein